LKKHHFISTKLKIHRYSDFMTFRKMMFPPRCLSLSLFSLCLAASSAQDRRVRKISPPSTPPALTLGDGTITLTVGDFQTSRVIHDIDGDGLCDLWASLYQVDENQDLSRDQDGDGLTDYQEMALMSDPHVANELPRVATPEELAAVKLDRERRRLETKARREI